jgi:hypothetical protein
MWRLPGDRTTLDLDGPSVEVEPLHSWHIADECKSYWAAFMAATKAEDERRALNALYTTFVAEALPSWDIADHRGPIPATAAGMTRLPLPLVDSIIGQWLQTLNAKPEREAIAGLHVVESDAPTAVDALIPPGPANREIKRRLRAAKKAA